MTAQKINLWYKLISSTMSPVLLTPINWCSHNSFVHITWDLSVHPCIMISFGREPRCWGVDGPWYNCKSKFTSKLFLLWEMGWTTLTASPLLSKSLWVANVIQGDPPNGQLTGWSTSWVGFSRQPPAPLWSSNHCVHPENTHPGEAPCYKWNIPVRFLLL